MGCRLLQFLLGALRVKVWTNPFYFLLMRLKSAEKRQTVQIPWSDVIIIISSSSNSSSSRSSSSSSIRLGISWKSSVRYSIFV